MFQVTLRRKLYYESGEASFLSRDPSSPNIESRLSEEDSLVESIDSPTTPSAMTGASHSNKVFFSMS